MLLLLPIAHAAVGVSPTALYFSEPEQQLFLINSGNAVPFSISGCDEVAFSREGILEEGVHKVTIRINPFEKHSDCTLVIALNYTGLTQTFTVGATFPMLQESNQTSTGARNKIIVVLVVGIIMMLSGIFILKYF